MPASRRLTPKLKRPHHRPAPTLQERISTPPPPKLTVTAGGDDDPLFDVFGLAAYLGVGHWWVYDHVNDLPTLKVGRFLKFRRSHVDRWLEAKGKK